MNIFSKLAILFIIVGAILVAGPVFGFGSFAADRGVNVDVTNDTSAYLGVFDNSANQSADVVSKNDDRGTVFYLDDNSGTYDASTIGATVTAFNGGSTELVAQVETADNSRDFAVVVSCGASNLKDSGTVTVAMNATGDPSVDLDRTTSEAIEVDCQGKSSGFFEVQSASTGDGNTSAVIEIENTGGSEQVKGISLDGTSSSADRVNNGNNPEIVFGNSVVNRDKNKKNTVAIDGTVYSLNENVASGDRVQITIEEFRNGTGPVDMAGETVEFTLYDSNNGKGKIQTIRVTLS